MHFEDAMLRTGVVPEVGMHLYLQVSEALTNSRQALGTLQHTPSDTRAAHRRSA